MGAVVKRYKVIKNFLSKEEVKIGSHYFNLMHKRNFTNFEFTKQSNNHDCCFYSDCFTDTILMKKRKKLEKELGLELYPTYAFTRVYTYNSVLDKHLDRAACEISVTLMWDNDNTEWPIFLGGDPIITKPGDAVIYLGCELEHWREPFTGDFQIQTFLHYVNKNGPNKEWKYDKRNFAENPEVV